MNSFFKVTHKSKKSKARLGEIKTSHGVVKTPAFVAVGTKGTVKALTPELLKDIGTQVAFVNTYHLVTHPGAEIIEKAGGIHKYSGLDIPLMSDSGGFQVFSLAKNNRARERNFLSQWGPYPKSEKNLLSSPLKDQAKKADIRGEEQPMVVKISEDGVKFRSTFDGKLIEFTPEKSMEYQAKIGADINMAFDECTYYPATHEYAQKAMERTHEWLKRCVSFRARQRNFLSQRGHYPKSAKNLLSSPSKVNQYLYGVIQGATYEDLRKKSAEFVVSQNTPGIAIGGVSVGESKKEMREQVKWVADYLPKDRPVHLLGVGQVDDIIDLVKHGIDTFDCVEPTRLARMGRIYQTSFVLGTAFFTPRGRARSTAHLPRSFKTGTSDSDIDIFKTIYKNNLEKLDINCNCYVCENFTKSYLHHLFKQREILGYTLATYHNLWTMEKLFEKIRALISQDLI
ncbi:queuine tRNA-ribosyltransferase family protein [Candidatus Roizmanbacteria bacterium]|nr:queuine tRNA-ribosyltransferase family protein [Candidatus Roizmanbacteria bacterium]